MPNVLLVAAVVLTAILTSFKRHLSKLGPREARQEVTPTELTGTAIELHAIHQRLNLAWTRIELRREADKLRRELAEEMRLAETLANRTVSYDR